MTNRSIPDPSTATRSRRGHLVPLCAVLALAGVLAGCEKSDIQAALNPRTTTTTAPVRKHQRRDPAVTVPSPDTQVPETTVPGTVPGLATTVPPTTVRPPSPTTTVAPSTPSPPPSTGTGCAAVPSRCGYPDTTNTGVPSGAVLRRVPLDVSSGPGWAYDSRGWVSVTGDGAVLENLYIPFNLDVLADNVTIRNVQIEEGGESFGISIRHATNVTIQDSTIGWSGAASNRLLVGIKDIYDDSNNIRILRSELFGMGTGVQMGAGLIQDSYIHDLKLKSGDHINGTTSNGSTRPLTIRHNTVFNKYDQTDAISLFEDFGTEANRLIENNLVAGGGYTIYGGANPGGSQTSNIRIVGNRFSRMYFAGGGYYGYATAFDPRGPGNSWSGNIWDDTGATVPAP